MPEQRDREQRDRDYVDYRELASRMLRILEELQAITPIVRENAKDIESNESRTSEIEKRMDRIFTAVFEGKDSLVSQLDSMRRSIDIGSDKDVERSMRSMLWWFETNKPNLQTLLNATEWVSNQRERDRQVQIQPLSKKAVVAISAIVGALTILAWIISHIKP
jgi:hypothetical protein